MDKVKEIVTWMEAENDMVTVPRGLLGAALSAIRGKRDAHMTIELLRYYAYPGQREHDDGKA